MKYNIKNKYNLFFIKDKISFIGKNNTIKEIFNNFKEKIKNYSKEKIKNISGGELILLKVKNVKFNPDQPIKMVFGPVKVEIIFYKITERGRVYQDKYERRNNHLFYTIEYLKKNKIKNNDLKKIVTLAINDKLEKRLLAPKIINQILK